MEKLYELFLSQNDSGYLTGKRKSGASYPSGKENNPNKRVRKALAWSSIHTSSSDLSVTIETPVSIYLFINVHCYVFICINNIAV